MFFDQSTRAPLLWPKGLRLRIKSATAAALFCPTFRKSATCRVTLPASISSLSTSTKLRTPLIARLSATNPPPEPKPTTPTLFWASLAQSSRRLISRSTRCHILLMVSRLSPVSESVPCRASRRTVARKPITFMFRYASFNAGQIAYDNGSKSPGPSRSLKLSISCAPNALLGIDVVHMWSSRSTGISRFACRLTQSHPDLYGYHVI